MTFKWSWQQITPSIARSRLKLVSMFSNYTWFCFLSKLQLSLAVPHRFTRLKVKSICREKMYKIIEKGSMFTDNYRIFFENENGPISPFHDIPLYADNSKKLYNMVVEIPRWTNAKMEIDTKERLNPIKQDIKKGKLRYVANCFPHHGYIWNYGAFPQTWENPLHLDDSTGCKGDNDPIDVVEIGCKVAHRGQVLRVKILGCLALVDEGETDWKIIVIDYEDPIAGQVNDLQDVEKFFPGLLKATVEWFKIYKIPDGKPENKFAFNGEPKNRDFAISVVEEVHGFWKSLIFNEINKGEIACENVTVESSPYKITLSEANEVINEAASFGPPAEADSNALHKWHYVTLEKE